MTTVDKLYMDNLSEFIFDEKRVVTFKFLSVTLGVHVNIAKMMLYQFHETSKKAGKKIYATYYVSGAILQGRSIDPTVPETQDCHNPLSGPHGYVVTLCKEKDLDIVKQRIMIIHSVHIYALSAFPLDNFDILQKAMSDPIFKERNPVDFGPLHCEAAQKILENPKEIKLPQEFKSSNDSTTNTQNKKTWISFKSASDNIFSNSTPDELNSGNNSSQPKALSDLFESDSDEDIPDVVKKPRSDEPVDPTGRKKVSKTVSKTFLDKDGFLVTTKEQVMVSEPETSDTETGSAQNASDTEQSKLAKSGSNKTDEKISDNKDTKTINKTKATKASNASTAAAKSKQSSLFSLFQKK